MNIQQMQMRAALRASFAVLSALVGAPEPQMWEVRGWTSLTLYGAFRTEEDARGYAAWMRQESGIRFFIMPQ